METAARITRISPLELTMREVGANMEELTAGFAFNSVPDCFELLAIEPPDPAVFEPPRQKAKILLHPRAHPPEPSLARAISASG